MKGTKRVSLGARKKHKRNKNRRFVKSIVAYLKSDGYMFAPLFSTFPPLTTEINTPPSSNSESSKTDDISVTGLESLGFERIIKSKRRMSEKIKEYLKSDCHMYRPVISHPKLDSSLKGKLQITNLVTMEVSTSSTIMREDNSSNYRNIRSDTAEQMLHNGRIKSPKRGLVILEEQRGGLSRETDLSSAISSLPEGKDGVARSKENYN